VGESQPTRKSVVLLAGNLGVQRRPDSENILGRGWSPDSKVSLPPTIASRKCNQEVRVVVAKDISLSSTCGLRV
jgi:hypothetical protein